MKSIDLLIWSVKPGKGDADRERLEKVNGKLISSIKKALRVAGVISPGPERILVDLITAQKASFDQENPQQNSNNKITAIDELDLPVVSAVAVKKELPVGEQYLREAASLPIGIWMEFVVDGTHTIRCALPAKISDPDAYVFVNRQGGQGRRESHG